MNPTLNNIHTQLLETKSLLNKGLIDADEIESGIDVIHAQTLMLQKMIQFRKGEEKFKVMQKIMEYTAEVFSLTVGEIKGPSREYDKALARQVFVICAKEKGFRYKHIAKALNRTTTPIQRMGRPSILENRLNSTQRSDVYREMAESVFDKFLYKTTNK